MLIQKVTITMFLIVTIIMLHACSDDSVTQEEVLKSGSSKEEEKVVASNTDKDKSQEIRSLEQQSSELAPQQDKFKHVFNREIFFSNESELKSGTRVTDRNMQAWYVTSDLVVTLKNETKLSDEMKAWFKTFAVSTSTFNNINYKLSALSKQDMLPIYQEAIQFDDVDKVELVLKIASQTSEER